MKTPTDISTQRLEFFSDAVLAVAITLMVLRISPPVQGPGQSEWEAFNDQTIPAIIYFLITFAVIVELWRHHHDIFERMPERATPRQMAFNLAFLATVCLIPFGLEYYTNSPLTMFSTAVYAVLLALPTLCLGLLGWDVTDEVPWGAIRISIIFLLAVPLTPLLGSWALIVWIIDLPLRALIDRRKRA